MKKGVLNEDFGRNWFQTMILRGDIDGARKVLTPLGRGMLIKAATWLNRLPNQRKYFYWLLTTWKVSAVPLIAGSH